MQKLRIGIVGCGEVTQIMHLPSLAIGRAIHCDGAVRCQPPFFLTYVTRRRCNLTPHPERLL